MKCLLNLQLSELQTLDLICSIIWLAVLAAVKVSEDRRVMNIEGNNKDTGKKSKFICKCMTNSPTASRRLGNTRAR